MRIAMVIKMVHGEWWNNGEKHVFINYSGKFTIIYMNSPYPLPFYEKLCEYYLWNNLR